MYTFRLHFYKNAPCKLDLTTIVRYFVTIWDLNMLNTLRTDDADLRF